MKSNSIYEQAAQFSQWYGDGADGMCPTVAQWEHILKQPKEKPITLINYFKLRERALYRDEAGKSDGAVSGQAAFDSYAAVSIPTMERVGGNFLFVGPFGGTFLGETESWDIVAIGSYPTLNALIDLYSDKDYRTAFPHRTAACERQKVLFCGDPE